MVLLARNATGVGINRQDNRQVQEQVQAPLQVQGQVQGQEHGTCKAATLQALCAAARPVEVTFGRSQTAITATPVAVGALEVELSKSVRRPTEA